MGKDALLIQSANLGRP